jgi:hypothetical protein
MGLSERASLYAWTKFSNDLSSATWKMETGLNTMFGRHCVLTFQQPGWCLNFSAQFIKNILFEEMKIKL